MASRPLDHRSGRRHAVRRGTTIVAAVWIAGFVAVTTPRSAAASVPTVCAMTEIELEADIAAAGDPGTVTLDCPNPTVIAFDSTITVATALAIKVRPTSAPVTLSGAPMTLSGGGRLFYVDVSGSLTLENLTVADGQGIDNEGALAINVVSISGNEGGYGGGIYNAGSLTIDGSRIVGNASSGPGGGIYNAANTFRGGTATIVDSTISNNQARYGGGIANGLSNQFPVSLTVIDSMIEGNHAESGGGIGTDSHVGAVGHNSLSIQGTTIRNNSAETDAGGIEAVFSTVAITDSTIAGNTAENGGGLLGVEASIAINGSTITGNVASRGGGVWSGAEGELTLTHSTVSGNTASSVAGGLYSSASLTVRDSTISGNHGFLGGGIYTEEVGSRAALDNVTIALNGAQSGGGIWNAGGQVTVRNATIAGNTALGWGPGSSGAGAIGTSPTPTFFLPYQVELANTIVEPGAPASGPSAVADCIGLVVDAGYNLEHGDGTCGFAGHAVSGDPRLGQLAPNGGQTLTMALGGGSSAIGAGSSPICDLAGGAGLDQRGAPRNEAVRGACDIGAFDTGGGAALSVSHVANGAKGWNVTSPVAVRIWADGGNVAPGAPPTCIDGGLPLTLTGTIPNLAAEIGGDGDHQIECTFASGWADEFATSRDLVQIDTIAPDVSLDNHPTDSLSTASASFSFSSIDATATFWCSIDSGSPVACASPASYEVANGAHSFWVVAIDPAGNMGPPAQFAWNVAAGASFGVASTLNPSIYGQAVSFVATVPVNGFPVAGAVAFSLDGGPDTDVAVVNGIATLTPPAFPSAGTHTLVASYAGDGLHPAAAASLSQIVLQADTDLVLTSLANPSDPGQSVTFSAAVSPRIPPGAACSPTDPTCGSGGCLATDPTCGSAGCSALDPTCGSADCSALDPTCGSPPPPPEPLAPTGFVTFRIDGTTVIPAAPLVEGLALLPSVADLTSGNHVVSATYSGDSNYAATLPADAPIVQQVVRTPTLTSVQEVAPDASSTGSLTVRATVGGDPPLLGDDCRADDPLLDCSRVIPTGSVTFELDGVAMGPAEELVDGVALSPPIIGLSPGFHAVTARYGGDGRYLPSRGVRPGLDQTPPTIVAAATTLPNTAGWYRTDVVIHFTCTDDANGSGIPVGACPADQTLTSSGTSTPMTVVDASGNMSLTSNTINVLIDKVAPLLTPSITPNPVLLNGQATAAPGAADALSGLASASCGLLDSHSVGSKAVNCTAVDNAGNSATASLSYRVIYGFSGFLQPVNDPNYPQACGSPCPLSVFKAGIVVPVKFQLRDANGVTVQAALGPVWLTPVRTGATSAGVGESTVIVAATTGGTFKWDATTQQYVFNWNTRGYPKGSIWTIGVTLDDGMTYRVQIGLS